MKNKSPRILIVDDNPKNIQVLASFLTEEGYDLEYSTNGVDALQWISDENFDLILLDIMMPEMNGFEFCEKIKSEAKNIDLPIIFLTAKTDIESITKAFQIGGVDYVSKPFNSEELLARVATHISLKQSKDKLKDMNLHLEEKVAERTNQLAEANVELQALDKAKSEFMMILSHEIRTPLNGILGGIQILREYEMPQETLEFFQMLDDSTQRLESFAIKTLEISQLRTMGKALLKLEPFKLNELITYCFERFKSKTTLKNLIVKLPTQEIIVHADFNYLDLALTQLIDNAIYHSPENAVIKIIVEETPGLVLCTILDQGEGFSDKILNKPIKTFYGDTLNIDQKKGLGLYLAKIITETHGGHLRFGNRKEGGAYVSLELQKV